MTVVDVKEWLNVVFKIVVGGVSIGVILNVYCVDFLLEALKIIRIIGVMKFL